MPKSKHPFQTLFHHGEVERVSIEDLQKAHHNGFQTCYCVKTKSHLKTVERLRKKLEARKTVDYDAVALYPK